jgi:deazaflavin-dependent oxidoreductase (nitroreductase family)
MGTSQVTSCSPGLRDRSLIVAAMTVRRPHGPGTRVRLATRVENFLDRHSVRFGAWLLRRTRGRAVRVWHRRALVLTTTGRRTGLPRTVVVQYFPDGRDLVVVGANSGMPTHPAWYLNLTEHPEAKVDVEGRTMRVHAEEMPPAEADAWWPRVLAVAPDYARYRARTDRRLPLLRLVPVEDVGSPDAAPPGTAHRPINPLGQPTPGGPTTDR